MIRKQTIAASALVAVLGIGVAIPTALAQESTEDTATEGTAVEQNGTSRAERHAEQRAELAAALAEELDLDASTVEAALERVQTAQAEQRAADRLADLQERLAAAVEAGELTQEQADALLDAQQAGVLDGFGGRGHGHGGRGGSLGPPATGAAEDSDQ